MKNRTKSQLFCLTLLLTIAATPARAQVPVGTYLDVNVVKNALTNGWQRALDTDKDPANNNKWNTHNGGDFGVGGLFGGIQETLLKTTFGTPAFRPITVVTQVNTTVPNTTNAVLHAPITMSFTHGEQITDTSTVSDAVKNGVDLSFEVSGTLFGMGAKAGEKFSMDYTHTKSNSNSTTQSAQTTASQTLNVDVPPGKTYYAAITCEEQTVDLPYHSDIQLKGQSHTWFDDRVNGHFNWNADVANVVAHMSQIPSHWTLPGDGSVLVTATQGKLTAQRYTNFKIVVLDITNANVTTVGRSKALLYQAKASLAPSTTVRAKSINELIPAGATLISTTPISK